jgi:hypothetical protein
MFPAPDGTESKYEIVEAPVLKVFSAEEGKHRFVAYLVKWKGQEVVASDTLARSNHRVGETIRFMAQTVSMGNGERQVNSLSFMVLPDLPAVRGAEGQGEEAVPPAEQKRQARLVKGDLDAAKNEVERFYALGRAAKKASARGETDKARALAEELEKLAPKYKKNWNYGNAVQNANQVLGRIALAKGDVAEAKKRLLASADSDGSPQMNSFGPNMQLARELLAKGEKEVVIQYFQRCATFWKMDRGRLAAWTKQVQAGKTPDFGANLRY